MDLDLIYIIDRHLRLFIPDNKIPLFLEENNKRAYYTINVLNLLCSFLL